MDYLVLILKSFNHENHGSDKLNNKEKKMQEKGLSEYDINLIINGMKENRSKINQQPTFNNDAQQEQESLSVNDLQGLNVKINDLLELKDLIQKKSLEKIEFAKPILNIGDYPLLYQNSITLLQGQKGSYKSKISEYMISLLLKIDNNYVVYIDTERSTRDGFPQAIQNIILKSKGSLDSFPSEYFSTYSFIDVLRKYRLEKLKDVIEYEKQLHSDKKLIVCLDVLSDFVSDFNSPEQALEILDFLNQLINNSDISIITVLHENPNSVKARGHLGTEVTNKSSLVVKCSREDDLAVLEFQHCRYAKVEKDKLYFKYSNEEHGLVYCDKAQEPEENQSELYLKYIYDMLGEGKINQGDLIKRLAGNFKKYGKEATQRSYLLKLENCVYRDKKLFKYGASKKSILWFWTDESIPGNETEDLALVF